MTTEQDAIKLAIEWARYFLVEKKPPPGHQLVRSKTQDEAMVPADWQSALTDNDVDPDKLPLFNSGDSHFDYDDEKGKALWERARAGDRDADGALANIARMYLLAGRQMPPNLTDYVIAILQLRYMQNPPRKKGGDPYANIARDMFIVGALSRLDRLGFTPTKSEATDKLTGSAIVAQALQQLGFDIDYPGVAKVWRRRDLVSSVVAGHPLKAPEAD